MGCPQGRQGAEVPPVGDSALPFGAAAPTLFISGD